MLALIVILILGLVIGNFYARIYAVTLLFSYYILSISQQYLSLDAYFLSITLCSLIPTLCIIHFIKKWDYVFTLTGILLYLAMMLSWMVEIPLLSYITYTNFDDINKTFIIGTLTIFVVEDYLKNKEQFPPFVRVVVFSVVTAIFFLW